MPTGSISSVVSVAGVSIQSLISRTADGQIAHEPALVVGNAGTLTTRTDDNTGVLTLGAGHTITTGMVIDLYWTGGVRYGMTVGTVSGTSVPIDLGAGDVLPAAATAIVCSKQVEVTSSWDGDLAVMMAASATKRCHLDFQDSGSASLLALELTASEAWSWASDTSVTVPITGNLVAKIKCSNGTTEAVTLKIGILLDTTP